MNCPKCLSVEFAEYETSEGVTVDFCGTCHGTWFDRGEVAFYVELTRDFPDLEKSLQHAEKTEHNCPKCPDDPPLAQMPYQSGKDLFVDYCRICQGVFFDVKEIIHLEELARKLESVGKIHRTVQELAKRGFVTLPKE